jgi:NADPH:quinone reductase-like Zn-dependent oxidoreductase
MTTGLQLFSKITQAGELQLSLVEVDVPTPGKGQVLVKMEAAPINPSDMWPMFGPADLRSASLEFSDSAKVLTAPIHGSVIKMMKSRFDQALPVGNEGAGTVVEAGEGAEHLMGKVVSLSSGTSYAQYCCVPAMTCLPLHDGTTAQEGASSFVNPLTALAMVETMKLEGHTALIHTAAASNLGQMLNKICIADGVSLINIVRKQEQVDILKGIGAKYIVDSSADSFQADLMKAIDETGATIAFDALGGGQLASDILACMERVLSKDAVGLNTYGSEQLKQVYLYGGLDISPTVLNRSYGMCWAVGGFLLPHFLKRVGYEKAGQLQARVAAEIKTTFASSYTQVLSFEEAMTPENIAKYVAKKTGEKYLINPTL